jgi:hypothetical protein
MLALPEPSRFACGFSSVTPLGTRHVAVRAGEPAGWHVLARREWTILNEALHSNDVAAIAHRSTAALQTAYGVRHVLAACDDLPAWCVKALFAISPWAHRHKDDLAPVGTNEAAQWLHAFVDKGLLAPVPERGRTPPQAQAVTVCVVTCDREAALRRSLATLTRTPRREYDVRLRVCDTSTREDARQHNRALCATTARETSYEIDYVGDAERRLLVRQFAAQGIDAATATFAVFGRERPTMGANRNAALLSTAGSMLVMLDDDVVPRTWVPWEMRRGVMLTHAAEPRLFAFAPSPQGLFRGLIERPEPSWSSHAAVLGRDVESVLQSEGLIGHTTLAPGSAVSWGELIRSRGRVRVTIHGVVGDCGMGWLRRLLVLEEPSRSALVTHRAVYEAVCRTGMAKRTTPCIQLVACGSGASGGTGLDARDIVPPFAPSYRCEDVLFLSMLHRIDDRSIVAFLPEATEHWPIEDRTRDRDGVWQCTGVRVWQVIDWIIRQQVRLRAVDSPSVRLAAIGRALREASGLSGGELHDLCYEVWLEHAARWFSATEHAVADAQGSPGWWADDVRRFRDKLTTELPSYTASIPCDVAPTGEDRLETVQAHLLALGRLFESWPAMWELATQRRSVRKAS